MIQLRASRSGGQVTDVEIDAVAANSDGLAAFGGGRNAVPFTIPGERVRIRLPGRRAGAAAATLLDVLRASPHRATPPCRHFGANATPELGPCAGCSWQHIAYAEQLRLKTQLVYGLVRAVVPRAPATKTTLAATPLDGSLGLPEQSALRLRQPWIGAHDGTLRAPAPAGSFRSSNVPFTMSGAMCSRSRRGIRLRPQPCKPRMGIAARCAVLRSASAAARARTWPRSSSRAIGTGRYAPRRGACSTKCRPRRCM